MLSICLIAYLVIIKSINEPFSSNIIFHYIEWLPLGIKGLMISGLFAILMSTADSHMNATSTIITNDFIKHYFPTLGSKGLLVVMKVIILVLSLSPFILIMYKEHLFQLMLVLRSFGTNMLIIPLAASLLGFKINKKQFISSCFFSMLFTTLSILLFNQYPLLLTFIGILELAVSGVCLLTKRQNLSLGLTAWLATCFLAYRGGLWYLGWQRPCSCLGNLTDTLHISPHVADVAMKIVLAYLLVGSYGGLLCLWKLNRKSI